jgi:hypothetical protein
MECRKMGPLRLMTVRAVGLKEGAVAATYETDEAARLCASSLEGRWFDGRRLITRLVMPQQSQSNPAYATQGSWPSGSAGVTPVLSDIIQEVSAEESAIVEAVAEDVENFLNSLL